MGEDVSDMHRFSARSEHGNTLPELLVVLALIAAMAFIAVPLLLTYLPSATVNYAARELQSGLNRAKLMAVRNSHDFACCARATVRECSKCACAFATSRCGDLSAISPATR